MKRVICLITALLVFLSSAILFAESVVLKKPAQIESANQYTDPTTGVTLTITGAWKKQPLPDSINKNQVVWSKSGNNLPYIMFKNGPLPAGITSAKDFADGLLFRYRQTEPATVVEDTREININGLKVVKMVTEIPKTKDSFILRTATYALVVGDNVVRIMISDDANNFANTEAETESIVNSIKIANRI